jgi:hypothetical protein
MTGRERLPNRRLCESLPMSGSRNRQILAAHCAMPAMVVEYAKTVDDPVDGAPIVPGIITDEDFWSVVARANGRTRWRRILLRVTKAQTQLGGCNGI